MSVFDLEKIKEELSAYDPLMPCVMKALRVIGRLCEEGRKLEAQRDWLAERIHRKGTVMYGKYPPTTKGWIQAAEDRTAKEAGE